MIVLSQQAWSAEDPAALNGTVGAASIELAQRVNGAQQSGLVLLPHSPAPAGDVPGEGAVREALAEAATVSGVYLAGSATLLPEDNAVPQTLGFVFDPQGELLLRVAKITPDLVEGFSDTTSVLGQPNDFPVISLPFAQVGMLIGEDILISHHARCLAFHGAEVILNPSIERNDGLIDIRIRSRWGRAIENACYVLTACPARMQRNGTTVDLPLATGCYGVRQEPMRNQSGESFLLPDFDIEAIRRARATPQGSYPAIVRADVYGRGYRQTAAEAQIAAAPGTREGWLELAQARLEEEARRIGPKLPKYEEQYDVVVMQTVPRLIPLASPRARELMLRNLEDNLALAATRANVPSMRLVIFPEFWLTGPGGIGGIQRTVQDLEVMAVTYPDPIFDRIAEFAQQNRVFVAFQNFEVHPKLPGRVFNSAFLMDDSGELIHTYRKNQCADVWGFLPDTTPGSILDEYLELFGDEALFPVADTRIGRLANMICFDNMHPEVAYGLRRAGAEVILHSSSEPHGTGRQGWDNVRYLRAFENTAYLLSAIDGGEYKSEDSEHMTYFRRGHARIINFDGSLQGTADGPGPVTLRGHVDLAALRRARANPLKNLALWNDASVYARHYSEEMGFPSNQWAENPYDNPYLGARQLREVIDGYLESGIYVPPRAKLGLDRYRTSDQV